MRLARDALEFQADLDRLVAEPAPLLLRLWPALGLGLLVGLVVVASAVRLDVVVTARGRLAADAPPAILAPMSRAVLRELLVRPGDKVVKGQVLARLDPTIPDADRAALLAQRATLAAQKARLEADLSGQTMPGGSPDLALQAEVQTQRAGLFAAQRAQLQTARDAAADALLAEDRAAQGLADRLAIAREVEAMRDKLAASQTGSRLAALEAELARIDAEAALNQHEARMKDLGARQASAEAALSAYDIDRRRADLEALAAVRPQLADVDEALSKADRLASLSDLVAPGPGVVISVAEGGAGSALTEGTPVVVLVPTDVALVAEIAVRSADAGSIEPGDAVDLKIDAFPWRRHGSLAGRLLDVSSASFTPPNATEAQHPARVRLEGALRDLPSGADLLPGMTLEADVKTGTRSVLDYFLDPLMRGLNEALREP
ncbi:HlyD family type I secretion periplasmic adaptor subunit [bacterium]|nr:HlyD family type I secretion periplasmic adaptor subunit [bacterium]